MMRERSRERRVHHFGPPHACTERRVATERRRVDALQESLHHFELLMASLGFRESRSGDML